MEKRIESMERGEGEERGEGDWTWEKGEGVWSVVREIELRKMSESMVRGEGIENV